jgi:hypothetical protein
MIHDALFVTGFQRSGTTLLEKVLGTQSAVSLLSQPFPLLFVEAKRAFLRTLGEDDVRYPLGHLFATPAYDPEALGRFLRGLRMPREVLVPLFARMSEYSGQYTRFTPEELEAAYAEIAADDDFAAVVARLQHALARDVEARWFGSKETVCEELLPYLLERGFRCLLIVRDPRDVVASLNHGRGPEFGGATKPTWFNVRSWRKSASYALALQRHPRFHWCRYEDLVADPAAELMRLDGVLGLGLSTPYCLELHDAGGRPWNGNSSHNPHDGISTSSVGIHRTLLDRAVAEVIEASCLPELQRLGYATSMTAVEAIRAIETFREPYPVVRPGLESDMVSAENARLEIARLERATEAGP